MDSGKTSLTAVLSEDFSTAALDKNPQSRERGITLDLGFSSFTTTASGTIRDAGFDRVQYTLVDCPGHASLVRTIIGGASIIDMMLLVIDATKGIQTQTAECLVVGEIATTRVVVVLNKIDLVPESAREAKLEKLEVGIRKVLENSQFECVRCVRVSARPGGMDNHGGFNATGALGITQLVRAMGELTPHIIRDQGGDFLLSVDHCFAIKGQGTVLTGTVLAGSVRVGELIQEPSSRETFKVKSMQMFRRSVKQAAMGDRVGVCVTGFNPDRMERGILCAPGSVKSFKGAIVSVRKIRYYRNDVKVRFGCYK